MSIFETYDEIQKIGRCYEANKSLLVSIAFNITRNHGMAEDAVNSAFCSVLEGEKKIFSKGEIDLLKWCVISVKNKCIDLLRKETRYAGLPIDDFEDYLPSGSVPIVEHLEEQEEISHLKSCLKMMDKTGRQLLEMKYDLGMTMKEIGEELGLTPDQVNSRMARARNKLKALMEKEVVGNVRRVS